MTTIYFAGGAEAFFAGAASTTTVDTLYNSSGAPIATRDSSWANRDGAYAVAAIINANNESGQVGPTNNGPNLIGTGVPMYINFRFQAPSDVITPAQRIKIVQMGATGWFANRTVEIETSGDLTIRNGGTTHATWSSPGLVAGVPYWLLGFLDSSTDTLSFWIGRADPNDDKLLASAGDWSGPSPLTYTDATQAGAAGGAICGFANNKLSNANTTTDAYIDSVVFMDDKPTQPRFNLLSQLDGDGNYSGGSTVWVKNGGGAATYTVIDDTVTATPDTTDYINYPTPDGSGVERVSFTMQDSATIGLNATRDTIIALLPLAWHRRSAGTAISVGQMRMMLRYNSTDLDGNTPTTSTSATYTQAGPGTFWDVFPTPPGGGSWTPAIFDATEVGFNHDDTTALFDAVFEFAWLGCYVIAQRAPVVRPPLLGASPRPFPEPAFNPSRGHTFPGLFTQPVVVASTQKTYTQII